MKKITCIVFVLIFSTKLFSQALMTENEKLASLCKVWGFLKYYNSEVCQGKLQWDKELTNRIDLVLSAKNRQELSKIYTNWINSLGTVFPSSGSDRPGVDSLPVNPALGWIDNRDLFTDSLICLLHYQEKRKQGKQNYYAGRAGAGNVNIKHEEPYTDSVYPSSGRRLLSLFRYWNIVNYFFPYKKIIGEDWDKVLEEMIPEFKNAMDTVSYHVAMKRLTVKTNDSHSQFSTPYTRTYYGHYFAPIKFKVAEHKAIVTGFCNDTLAGIDDIKYGDVILAVDGKNIEALIEERKGFFGASDEAVQIRNMVHSAIIFNGRLIDGI